MSTPNSKIALITTPILDMDGYYCRYILSTHPLDGLDGSTINLNGNVFYSYYLTSLKYPKLIHNIDDDLKSKGFDIVHM